MIGQFPSPVLSLASDVLKDLEGGDTLSNLWTLFTKCKESLQDGRRLENISWRLWYREMALAHSSAPSTPSSQLSVANSESPTRVPTPDPGGTVGFFASALLLPPGPPTPSSPPRHYGAHVASPHPSSPSVISSSHLSSSHLPSRRPRTGSHVGRIICEILPDKLVVPVSPQRSPSIEQPPAPTPAAIAAPHEKAENTLPVVVVEPRISAPSTPQASTLFPRVVIVNPTPHPTPPATPHLTSNPPLLTSSGTPLSLLPPGPSSKGTVLSGLPPLSSPSTSRGTNGRDETLKLSDRRRFFLQSESPDKESPERGEPSTLVNPPDLLEVGSGTSATSTGSRQSNASGKDGSIGKESNVSRRSASALGKRRGKEAAVGHPRPTRPGMHRTQTQRPTHHNAAAAAAQRKSTATQNAATTSAAPAPKAGAAPKASAAPKARPMFRIGSTSSAGSKQGTNGGSDGRPASDQDPKSPPAVSPATKRSPPVVNGNGAPRKVSPMGPPPVPPAAAARPSQDQRRSELPPRRGIVVSTSSEYETTDSDEDSWESEDLSHEEVRKPAPSTSKKLTKEEVKLREAALEAQRQRDMFAKLPKRSYSQLQRTQSGLLSQLLNPDPTIFPLNHPYRSRFSSDDITQHTRQLQRSSSSGTAIGMRMPLQTSKSSAALPQQAKVQVTAPVPGGTSGNGYRPKGRPQGEELEEDTDTEDESAADNTIQVSTSLAQQKLAALAGPRRRTTMPPPDTQRSPERRAPNQQQRPTLTSVATAPIALGHPYNLPAPAEPMTPRTTRRQMLATELSESLRRNLLWERQVSKINMTGGARRHGLLGNGLRPLTTVTANVVSGEANGGNANGQTSRHTDEASQSGNEGERVEREARKKQAMARNRSWADDYHYSGW